MQNRKIKKFFSFMLCCALLLCTALLPGAAAADTNPAEISGSYVYVDREMTWEEFVPYLRTATGYYNIVCHSETVASTSLVKTGMDVSAIQAKPTTKSWNGTVILLGDLDQNGYVNYNDYQYYLECIRYTGMSSLMMAAADVNRSGTVDSRDKLLFKDKVKASASTASAAYLSVFGTYGTRLYDVEPNTTWGTLQYSLGYLNLTGSGTLYDIDGSQITSSSTIVTTGMTYKTPNNISYRIIILGDVDRDGNVTISDVMQAIRVKLNPTAYADYVQMAADADMNGTLNDADAEEISYIIAQKA